MKRSAPFLLLTATAMAGACAPDSGCPAVRS